MRRIKCIMASLCMVLVAVMSFGCIFITGNTLEEAKGTYKLTNYVVTDGKTNEPKDYIVEEGYEVYLVVTGTEQGYYVHKDNSTAAYKREVILSYRYNAEDAKRLDYVVYNFGLNSEEQELGVTKGGLNYSRPRIKFSDKIHQDGIDINWRKVSDATDLSYAQAQLGELAEYGA